MFDNVQNMLVQQYLYIVYLWMLHIGGVVKSLMIQVYDQKGLVTMVPILLLPLINVLRNKSMGVQILESVCFKYIYSCEKQLSSGDRILYV